MVSVAIEPCFEHTERRIGSSKKYADPIFSSLSSVLFKSRYLNICAAALKENKQFLKFLFKIQYK